MLAKICSPKTRGTFFGINGVLSSFAIVLLQKLGELTSESDRTIVYWGTAGVSLCALVPVIVLVFMGKLKH